MIFGKEIAFAVATFGESINPGPTVATLVDARTRSREEAWGVVVGVAFANVLWVLIVIGIHRYAPQFLQSSQVVPYLNAVAACILVFIATRASIGAAIAGIEYYLLKSLTASATAPVTSFAKSFYGGVVTGFWVHFVNPLSFSYYGGIYTATLANDPSLAIVFSFIAVAIDFLVYGIFASIPVNIVKAPSSENLLLRRIFSLAAGFAMLFLVARVFAQVKDPGGHLVLPGLRNFAMLLGFLAGTIWEAEEFANRYGRTKNRLLWRGVLVWQSALTIFAIIGTILSVLARLEPESISLDRAAQIPIAICALVAAVGSGALSYARAKGELLDEDEILTAAGATANLPRTRSFNSPRWVFPFLLACLIALGAFFVYSGFSGQIRP